MAIRTGTNGNDTLLGTTGSDTLNGLDGDDILDGGLGADIMNGGKGNDVYIVDNGNDVVTEKPGEGVDLVKSAVSYTLTVNVENLTLTGTANNRGTGNALDNIITGNSGDNALSGGAGNDTLVGGAGNDVLDGGTGADTLSGGKDSDVYIVDNILDIVLENAGEGIIDTIESAVSYTAPANVEALLLTGSSAIDGTGNAQANLITGNNAANILNGRGGNDLLFGRGGNDTLLFSLNENGAALDAYSGGEGIDTLRLMLTAAEWADPVVQSEIARYNQYLTTKTGEVGDFALFTFDFGHSSKLVMSGTEKLEVQVGGSTIDFHAPTITGATATAALFEGPAGIPKLAASGEIAFSDLDYNDTHTIASPVTLASSDLLAGHRGTLSASVIDDTVGIGDTAGKATWNYEIDNAALKYLKAGQTAVETFDVAIVDSTGKSATQRVAVTITGINDAPISSSDSGYGVDEDGVLSVVAAMGLLKNDTDPESDPLTAVFQSGPAHGALALASDGSFSYTPDANYFGPDSFSYKANDGSVDGNLATVSIEVNAVNDAPVATDKTINSAKFTSYLFNVRDFGYSDADHNSLLNVKIDELPQFGRLTDDGARVSVGDFISAADIAAGKLVFTPSTLISGNDNKISFQVQDDGGTAKGGLDTSLVPNVFNVHTFQGFNNIQGLSFPDSLSGKAPVTASQQTDSLAGFLNLGLAIYGFPIDQVIDLFIPITGEPYTFQVLPTNPVATEYKLASISEVLANSIPALAPPHGASINSSGTFSWTPDVSDIGKEYYFNVQAKADDGNTLFDLTPLDLANNVTIRAHAYKPIEPITPATQIVLIPYDGTVNEPVAGTNDSVSTSSITIDTVLTVTAPFSVDTHQTLDINITESSVIMVFPQSQIDLALQSFDPNLSVFVSNPVSAIDVTTSTLNGKPTKHMFYTNPDPVDLGSTITPDIVDSPISLVGDYFSVLPNH
jgi:VCBS repeat-containing protein